MSGSKLPAIRMGFAPVVGNLLPGADPHLVVLLDIVKETLQRTETARTPKQPAVHPHGHHLRRGFSLGVQHVKAVFQIGIKLLRGVEPWAVAKRMSLASRV